MSGPTGSLPASTRLWSPPVATDARQRTSGWPAASPPPSIERAVGSWSLSTGGLSTEPIPPTGLDQLGLGDGSALGLPDGEVGAGLSLPLGAGLSGDGEGRWHCCSGLWSSPCVRKNSRICAVSSASCISRRPHTSA